MSTRKWRLVAVSLFCVVGAELEPFKSLAFFSGTPPCMDFERELFCYNINYSLPYLLGWTMWTRLDGICICTTWLTAANKDCCTKSSLTGMKCMWNTRVKIEHVSIIYVGIILCDFEKYFEEVLYIFFFKTTNSKQVIIVWMFSTLDYINILKLNTWVQSTYCCV